MAVTFDKKDSEKVEIVSQLFHQCSLQELRVIQHMKKENKFTEKAQKLAKLESIITKE